MNFEVTATNRFYKDISKLEKITQKKVFKAIEKLGNDPFGIKRQQNIKKIKDKNKRYRLRVGDYRVFYTIGQDEICLLTIAHRRDAY